MQPILVACLAGGGGLRSPFYKRGCQTAIEKRHPELKKFSCRSLFSWLVTGLMSPLAPRLSHSIPFTRHQV